MKLYYHPLSGHSHRARLLLSLLGVEHELIEVDLMKGAHKSAEFLKLNRFGQVPVRAPEGSVDLSGYPNVNAWLRRIEALPGFVEFRKTPVGLAA
jgi:glutathione S-transferase